jgi:hemerythrin
MDLIRGIAEAHDRGSSPERLRRLLDALLGFLYDWSAQHTSETDRELARFLDAAR